MVFGSNLYRIREMRLVWLMFGHVLRFTRLSSTSLKLVVPY